MSTTDTGLIDRLRQPEYTGENRCTPCTIVNTAIAVAIAVAVGLAAWTSAGAVVGAGLGAALFALFGATIYLRGYLVPGTPTLTKRYFPDWLLAKFDKLPENHPDARTAGNTGTAAADNEQPTTNPDDVPVEDYLLAADAVEPCADVDDLCLTDAFEAAWQREVGALDDAGREQIASVLGVEGDAEINEHGDAFVLTVDGRRAGQWESEAALLSDLAAANVLADQYDEWTDLDSIERGQVVGGLRIFVETCPTCGGPVSLTQDTVESCCRSYEVVAASCGDCEARLLEVGM